MLYKPLCVKYGTYPEEIEYLYQAKFNQNGVAFTEEFGGIVHEPLQYHLDRYIDDQQWHEVVSVLLPDGRMLVHPRRNDSYSIPQRLAELPLDKRIEKLYDFCRRLVADGMNDITEHSSRIKVDTAVLRDRMDVGRHIALAFRTADVLNDPYHAMLLGRLVGSWYHSNDDYPFSMYIVEWESWPALRIDQEDANVHIYILYNMHVL